MMIDMGRIREALQFIDASDRDTWVEMGMAIHAEFADAGFVLWDEWSQQAESYETASARDVWKGFRAGGGKNIGSLIRVAKENGWRDDGCYQKPTSEEIAERRRIAAERAEKEEAEIARERADTAKNAAAIFKEGTDPVDNHYLVRKHVSPVATLREIDAGAAAAILGYAPKSGGNLLTGRLLVAPVKQGDRLSTLELIDGAGRKAALAGRGSKAGGYWATERLPNGDGPEPLQFCEGVATTLSAKEATGAISIATLSAGNMPTLARIMRKRYLDDGTPVISLGAFAKHHGKSNNEAQAMVQQFIAVRVAEGLPVDGIHTNDCLIHRKH